MGAKKKDSEEKEKAGTVSELKRVDEYVLAAQAAYKLDEKDHKGRKHAGNMNLQHQIETLANSKDIEQVTRLESELKQGQNDRNDLLILQESLLGAQRTISNEDDGSTQKALEETNRLIKEQEAQNKRTEEKLQKLQARHKDRFKDYIESIEDFDAKLNEAYLKQRKHKILQKKLEEIKERVTDSGNEQALAETKKKIAQINIEIANINKKIADLKRQNPDIASIEKKFGLREATRLIELKKEYDKVKQDPKKVDALVLKYLAQNPVDSNIRTQKEKMAEIFSYIEGSAGLQKKFNERNKLTEKHIIVAEMELKGFELTYSSKVSEDTDKHSFQCLVFINRETKELIFATAGTRPDHVDDLRDDARLIMNRSPRKLQPAKDLNTKIINDLGDVGDEIRDYTITYTGHSLGAAMAQIQAVDMDIKLREKYVNSARDKNEKPKITSITFENPGARKIIENMYQDYDPKIEKHSYEKLDFKVFNNRKNIINHSGEQAGEVYTIIPEGQEKRTPTPRQLLFGFLERKIGVLSSKLALLFAVWAPGGLGVEVLKDHSLENFNKVFVKKEGHVRTKDKRILSLSEATTGLEPVKYDRTVFKSIQEIQSMSASNSVRDEKKFCMTRKDKYGSLETIIFSMSELEASQEFWPKHHKITQKASDLLKGHSPTMTHNQDTETKKDVDKEAYQSSIIGPNGSNLRRRQSVSSFADINAAPKLTVMQKAAELMKKIIGVTSRNRLAIHGEIKTAEQLLNEKRNREARAAKLTTTHPSAWKLPTQGGRGR